LVAGVERRHGRVDLFCANAGIASAEGVEMSDELWERMWQVNVMAHVHAARAVLPGMLARGSGYMLATVSAAGLLTNIGAAAYSVTKHAALGLAEWLAVTYGDQGLKVSALCPQFVDTRMIGDFATLEMDDAFIRSVAITPDEAAEAVVEGLRAERFLILPHPEVQDYFRNKAADHDRWLAGMRKLQRSWLPGPPRPPV
jgi:NAD(P)-dependent dehydrogenase (short-subunit alcohol dehydrogenase family)